MPDSIRIEEVRSEIMGLAESAPSAPDLMEGVCKTLHARMLEQFVGAMTPHTRIPLNQGICGAAASSGKTVVVDDVSKDPRYLACSLETKSEIVVPIFVNGKGAGELQLNSHFSAAFGAEDQN